MGGYGKSRGKGAGHHEEGGGGKGATWVPPDAPQTTLWVGGVPESATLADILAGFARFGSILNATVGGRPAASGDLSGFIRFGSVEVAEAALRAASNKEVVVAGGGEGRDIKCQWSRQNCFSPGMEANICVAGLPPKTGSEDLVAEFSKFGTVKSAAVAASGDTGAICFKAAEQAEAALAAVQQGLVLVRRRPVLAWRAVEGMPAPAPTARAGSMWGPAPQEPAAWAGSMWGPAPHEAAARVGSMWGPGPQAAPASKSFWGGGDDPPTTLWVGGIPAESTLADLLAGFCPFGVLLNATTGGKPGKSGDLSGFVRFATREAAEKAMSAAAAGEIMLVGNEEGRQIKCEWSRQNCYSPGMDCSICLSGLLPGVTGEQVGREFTAYGTVQCAGVTARGSIGAVCFGSVEEAEMALQAVGERRLKSLGPRMVAWRPNEDESQQEAPPPPPDRKRTSSQAQWEDGDADARHKHHRPAGPPVQMRWGPPANGGWGHGDGHHGPAGRAHWDFEATPSHPSQPALHREYPPAQSVYDKRRHAEQQQQQSHDSWGGGGARRGGNWGGGADEPMTTLWVGGIPANSKVADLLAGFCPHGGILNATTGGRPAASGDLSGFIRFASVDAAERALRAAAAGEVVLAGNDEGRQIRCQWSRQNCFTPGIESCLCLGDLPPGIDGPTLALELSSFGSVQSAGVAGRGDYGAVCFRTAMEAEAALSALMKGVVRVAGTRVRAWRAAEGLRHEVPLSTIWVGGIPAGGRLADVLAGFCPFGAILNATIAGRPGATGDQSGFVRFATREEAEMALAAASAGEIVLPGNVEGREIKCQWSRQDCATPGMDCNICLSGVPAGLNLEAELGSFGAITASSVIEGKGLAAVCFESREAAEAALQALQRREVLDGAQVEAWRPAEGLQQSLTTLWVGGIPGGSGQADLLAGFCSFGGVLGATIGGRPGKSGDLSAFVRFASRQAAEAALEGATHGRIALVGNGEGRAIRCQWARQNNYSPETGLSICMQGLPSAATAADLRQTFSTFGHVQSAAVVAAGGTGAVIFSSREAAQAALEAAAAGEVEVRGHTIVAWRPSDGPSAL